MSLKFRKQLLLRLYCQKFQDHLYLKILIKKICNLPVSFRPLALELLGVLSSTSVQKKLQPAKRPSRTFHYMVYDSFSLDDDYVQHQVMLTPIKNLEKNTTHQKEKSVVLQRSCSHQ